MTDKPKRKNTYRRWYAFRGLILALIIFMGAVGYFLTREPESEYIIYQVPYSYLSPDSRMIKQVNIYTLEAENLTAPDSQNFSISDFAISGDGQVLVYLEYELDFGVRAYISSIPTGERQLLVELFECIDGEDNCILERLNFDGSKLIFRVGTTDVIWYEMDIRSGERHILAQTGRACTQSVQHYLICEGYDSGEYYIVNYESDETTILDGLSEVTFSDTMRRYAYTVPSLNQSEYPIFDNLPLPVEQEIYVGEWDDESSIRSLDTQRVNTLGDWHPDNERLLISVYTEEYDIDGGYEFILYNVEMVEQTRLLYLRGTRLSGIEWNEAGTHFLYILTPMYGLNPKGSIWVYELNTGETWEIGTGVYPHWTD